MGRGGTLGAGRAFLAGSREVGVRRSNPPPSLLFPPPLPPPAAPQPTLTRRGSAAVGRRVGVRAANLALGERLRVWQILAPPLAPRAPVFANRLALKAGWMCTDLPYFLAPGARACDVGVRCGARALLPSHLAVLPALVCSSHPACCCDHACP